MAIYSLHVSNVSRAAGSSAVASCSYITSRRMRDERTGEAFNGFGRRERVEHVCTMLPEGAPGEYLDPERLFNAVQMAEKRSDARPAKKIMVALPREFDARERFRALEDFISWNITANGYACTYAIHTDKDGRNPHAHILVANRQIDPATGGWARLKQRMEYVLDERGERVPLIDPETGRQKTDKRGRRQWKRTSVSLNPLDRKAKLKALRESWANTCNARLDETARIDHRSLEDQGSALEPTIHEGYASREMEKRGGRGDLCEENRRIQALNRLLDALRAMIGRLSDQAQGILTAVKRRQRPSGAPQAPSSPE
ncbi:MobA/MobL family protein, partial [Enterococcus mundtii]|uniref:MobA/MobL family protein n=1 Tax=Enterococcus mundtii TaxID=53346 RepID=UPI0013710435|nr:MobA/MobL family protein [Enterococcus mundtii]